MATTYIDRNNNNTEVYRRAEEEVNRNRSHMQKQHVKLLSEVHTDLRIKWAGDVLRLADQDPRRYTTY